MALVETGLLSELNGDVVFMAVPAEEAIEAEYERKLLEEGKIKIRHRQAGLYRLRRV